MRLAFFLTLLTSPAFAEDAPVLAELAPRQVVTEFAHSQAAEQNSFAGVVTARIETDLGFPLNGTIAERLVTTGDIVAKGDVLARLNAEDLDADVRAAQAGVSVATAQLRAATNSFERASELAARGIDSAKNLEDAERALTAAKARLEQAQATLARANDMRGFAQLVAHADGVITQVYEESGASLTAGQPVLRLSDTDGREITIDLAEEDAMGLGLGAMFEATLSANPAIQTQASLTRIDPVAANSTRTRRVHLTLAETPMGFRLGALTQVVLIANPAQNVSLDVAAILNLDTTPQVWVVDRATNTAHLTGITVGETAGSRIAILTGLTVGDEVITKGINSITDGQIVGPRVSK